MPIAEVKPKQKSRRLVRYLRDANRHPRAVVVFFRSNKGEVKFGWSKWNPHDAFDRRLGLTYALKRSAPVAEMNSRLCTIEMATLDNKRDPRCCIPEFVRGAWAEAEKYFTPHANGPKRRAAPRTKAGRES